MKRKNYYYVGKKVYFLHEKDGVMYQDPFVTKWSEKLELNGNSRGTVIPRASLIFKFWIYSLYFPPDKEQTIENYIAKYKNILLKTGFEIKKKVTTTQLTFLMTIYRAKKKKSVLNDLIALQSFFEFVYDYRQMMGDDFKLEQLPHHRFYFDALDFKKQNARDKYSKGHGYGLKARGLMRNAMAKRINVLTALIKTESRNMPSKTQSLFDSDTMSIQAFELLLKVAPTNRKLLYLLCATSPRIGQALHLTWFDVDITNKRVFLVNPKSRNKQLPTDARGYLFQAQPPREDLIKDYGIDLDSHPHTLIRWKTGEIPSVDDTEGYLHFPFDHWRDMFFETYRKVFNETPSTNRANNPFVFQKASGKRLLPSELHAGLEADLKLLKKIYGIQIEGGFHIFRHMFGAIMAASAYLELARDKDSAFIDTTGSGTIESIIDVAKVITRRKMGHATNSSSIDVYFKPDLHTTRYFMSVLKDRSEELRKNTEMIERAIRGEVF